MGIYNVYKYNPYPFKCSIKGRKVTVKMEAFWAACRKKVEATEGLIWDESVVQGVAPV